MPFIWFIIFVIVLFMAMIFIDPSFSGPLFVSCVLQYLWYRYNKLRNE